jgi:hypothetical protein
LSLSEQLRDHEVRNDVVSVGGGMPNVAEPEQVIPRPTDEQVRAIAAYQRIVSVLAAQNVARGSAQ